MGSASNPGDIDLPTIDWYLKIKSTETAVTKGEVLAIDTALGGIVGATERQLVTPIFAGFISMFSGPIVVALEGGLPGNYISVRAQGRVTAKMGVGPIKADAPLFIQSATAVLRRFEISTTDSPFAVWGRTLGTATANNQQVPIILSGIFSFGGG